MSFVEDSVVLLKNNMDSKREDCPWPAVQEKVSDSGVSLYKV